MNSRRAFWLAGLVFTLAAWRSHPIHAARVELDAADDGRVSVLVRVYRDDVAAMPQLADIGRYLDRVIMITDGGNRRVALSPTAMVAEGDRLKIFLTGKSPAGLDRGRIALTLLQEQFSDQVNVVDARVRGRRAQLVFLRGDGPQALP